MNYPPMARELLNMFSIFDFEFIKDMFFEDIVNENLLAV